MQSTKTQQIAPAIIAYSVPGILTAVLAILMAALSFYTGDVNPEILDTHVRSLHIESTDLQRLAYATVLLAFIIYAAWLLAIKTPTSDSETNERGVFYFLFAVTIVFLVGQSIRNQALTFLFAMAGFHFYRRKEAFRSRTNDILDGLKDRSQSLRILGWSLLIFAIALYWFLPFLTPVFVENPQQLRAVDGHYAVTVLNALNLVEGDGTELGRSYYGFGMPMLIAGFLTLTDYVGITGIELTDAVKFYQCIALAVITGTLAVINRASVFVSLWLIVLLTAYTLSGLAGAVGFPNQSGVRYVPILFCLLLFAIEVRRKEPRLSVTATIAAAGTLLNPETGFALSAGLVTAIVLKRFNRESRLISTVLSVLLFVATFVIAFALLYQATLHFILANSDIRLFEFLGLFGVSGYGGLVDRLSLGAGMMFLISTTILLKVIATTIKTRPTSKDLWQAALATIILVWLFYYINRMSEWNLWFNWVLLIFLIAPDLHMKNFSRETFRYPGARTHFFSVLVALFSSQAVIGSADAFDRAHLWLKNVSKTCPEADRINGFCMHGLSGHAAAEQIRAMKRFDPQHTFALTGYPTAARRLGFNKRLPVADPMEIVMRKDEKPFADWLDKNGPRFIIADGPESAVTAASPEHTEQILRYVNMLNNYRELNRESGWIILERLSPASQPQSN